MKFQLMLLLAFVITLSAGAQGLSQSDFDVYPKFSESAGNFNTYIADHVQKPAAVTRNYKGGVTLYMSIDSAGNATIASIYPDKFPEVTAALTNAIAAAPKWIPAQLNGLPVSSSFPVYFNVELNQASSTFMIHALAQARQPETTGDVVLNMAQNNPDFVGGQYGINRYFRINTLYPKAAKDKGITGQVYVEFIVEKDGSLSDITVLRDPGYGLGEEAVRMLCLMPNWTPGLQNGKAVRVHYVLPVDFTLASKN